MSKNNKNNFIKEEVTPFLAALLILVLAATVVTLFAHNNIHFGLFTLFVLFAVIFLMRIVSDGISFDDTPDATTSPKKDDKEEKFLILLSDLFSKIKLFESEFENDEYFRFLRIINLLNEFSFIAGRDVHYDVFTFKQSALDYLPSIFDSYVKIPKRFRYTQKIDNERTAYDVLVSQLDAIEDRLMNIAIESMDGDASSLLVNERFLLDRFSEKKSI